MQQEQVQTQEPHALMRAGRRMTDILHRHFEFAELWTGMLSLIWGAWMLNPLTDVTATSPTFRLMIVLAPEWAWGLWLTLAGLMQVYGLALNHVPIRRLATLATFYLWSFVATVFVLANPAATSSIVYPMIALAVGWSHLRVGQHRRMPD